MDPNNGVLHDYHGDSSEEDLGPMSPYDGDSDQSSANSKKRKRGSYRCSRCGMPKKRHSCPDNFEGVTFAIVDSPNPRVTSSSSGSAHSPALYISGVVTSGIVAPPPPRFDDKNQDMLLVHQVHLLREENLLLRQELGRLSELLHLHRINPLGPLTAEATSRSSSSGLMSPHHHPMVNMPTFPNNPMHGSSNALLPSGAPLLPPSSMQTAGLNNTGNNLGSGGGGVSSYHGHSHLPSPVGSAAAPSSSSFEHHQTQHQHQQQQHQHRQLQYNVPLQEFDLKRSSSERFSRHTSAASTDHQTVRNQSASEEFPRRTSALTSHHSAPASTNHHTVRNQSASEEFPRHTSAVSNNPSAPASTNHHTALNQSVLEGLSRRISAVSNHHTAPASTNHHSARNQQIRAAFSEGHPSPNKRMALPSKTDNALQD